MVSQTNLTILEYMVSISLTYQAGHVSGFSGLEVACWHLVPKFAGSKPAEAVRFLRANKNPQHALLRRGSKTVGHML